MFSVVMSTIGCPFVLDAVRSMRSPPEELVVVLDCVGRRSSQLDALQLLELLDQLGEYPFVRKMLYDVPESRWAVMNGCFNLGWKTAIRPFVLFTHDDVIFPEYDFNRINPILDWLIEHQFEVERKKVAGVVLPEYETAHYVTVPEFPAGTICLTQRVSPVSMLLAKWALHEMGGFDEEEGIWYDGQLQAETHLRNWWYLHAPTPPIRHESNKTYRANNWGGGWRANPKWGNFQANFALRYGEDFHRKLELEPAAELVEGELRRMAEELRD